MNEKKPSAELDVVWFEEAAIVDPVALERIIEEVRLQKELPSTHAYNRIHNRHNR